VDFTIKDRNLSIMGKLCDVEVVLKVLCSFVIHKAYDQMARAVLKLLCWKLGDFLD